MKKSMKLLLVLVALEISTSLKAQAQSEDSTLTYDIGISSGKDTNDNNYTEGNVGLNWRFQDFLTWRNAIFGRFASGQENTFGLDTSLRGILEDQSDQFGYHFFIGPGYRFATRGENLPFAETGLVFKLGTLNIGGGAKAFFNKLVDSNSRNETQYFIILGGGGSL